MKIRSTSASRRAVASSVRAGVVALNGAPPPSSFVRDSFAYGGRYCWPDCDVDAAGLGGPAQPGPEIYLVQGKAARSQLAVFGSEPGEASYSPVSKETVLMWKASVSPVLITSETRSTGSRRKACSPSGRRRSGSTARSSRWVTAGNPPTRISRRPCRISVARSRRDWRYRRGRGASAAASPDAEPHRLSSVTDGKNERHAGRRTSQKEAASIGVTTLRNGATCRYADRVKNTVDIVAPRDPNPRPPRRRNSDCDRRTTLDNHPVLGEVPPGGRVQGAP